MNYFVIIRGPLGVGKSTIAKRLAKLIDAEYISIDEILDKYKLGKVDEKAGCISVESFIEADDIALPGLERKMKAGKTIIFDGCFYHEEQIGHLIQNLPFAHFIFTLKAPLEVCIERDRKRGQAYGTDATGVVYRLVSRFDSGTVIDISKKDIDQSVNEILKHLPKEA